MTDIDGDIQITMALDSAGTGWVTAIGNMGFDCCDQASVPPGDWAGAILDGYEFSDEDVRRIRGLVARGPLVAIDDKAMVPSGTDLVINYAFHLSGASLDGIPALLGPSYALIDPEYVHFSQPAGSVDRNSEILIAFGQVDSRGATCVALEALAAIPVASNRRVVVTIGSQSPRLGEIEKSVGQYAGHAELRVDAQDMRNILQQTEIVIGGGGVSLCERMASGVASVSIVQAEMQRASLIAAAEKGGTLIGGDIDNLSVDSLSKKVETLINNPGLRRSVAATGRRLVDGQGAARVAQALIAKEIPQEASA